MKFLSSGDVLLSTIRSNSSIRSTALYNNAKKDGRQILKEIFTSCADLIPDYQNDILYVRLHSLSTPRANTVAKYLCEFLNDTNATFPMTNFKLIYELVAP